jgi:hypothetical protein
MATITQTRTLVLNSNAGEAFTFDLFDPALGTLTNARVGIIATTGLDVSAENLDLRGVTLNATAVGSASVYLNNSGAMVLASTKAAGSASLGAYDGAADFAGSSGVAGLDFSGTSSGSSEVLALVSLTGKGTLLAEASVNTALSVAAGAGLRLLTDGSNTVEATLTYDYIPAGGGDTSGSVITTGGSFTDIPIVTAPASFTAPTVTTATQTFSFVAQATGWSGNAAVARFDPSQGTLRAVNLMVGTSLAAQAAVESHEEFPGYFSAVNQTVTTNVTAPGLAGVLSGTKLGTAREPLYLGGFDGTDDFAGPSGTVLATPRLFGSTSSQVTDSTALSAFTGTGTIGLGVETLGGSSIDGYMTELLAELTATSDATLSVSYTYEPSAPVTPIAVANGTTGGSSTPTPVAYSGPVAGILNAFAQITSDSIAVSAAIDSWYIRTGDGNDAIQVFGGTNVLDGGRGSNFLTGGAGQDTFFVDAQWVTGPIWNTIENLAPGDAVTIWGIDSFGWTMAWRDGQGAAGHEGLTLHARVPAGAAVSVTLSGYARADLDSGRLATSYGTADDVPYFHIRAV